MSEKNDEILNQVIDIIKFVGENNLSELELETKDFNMKLKKHGSVQQNVIPQTNYIAQPAIVSKTALAKSVNGVKKEDKAAKTEQSHKSIKAPMAGTFYAASSPDAAPFVKVGDTISSGQTICIIEAMKMLNEIKADKTGKIIAIKGKNGELIEKGADLVVLE